MSLFRPVKPKPKQGRVNLPDGVKLPTTFKDSRFGIFAPAGIAFLAALLATLIGQQINASVETSKVVRLKLEDAYFRTLTLPRYAGDLNTRAVSPIQASSAYQSAVQYNMAVKQYSDEVAHLVAVADLYEVRVANPAYTLEKCSSKFRDNSADYFIHAYKLSSQNLTNTPFTAKQLNDLVAIRLECESAITDLRKAIATAMKRHLSHWLF